MYVFAYAVHIIIFLPKESIPLHMNTLNPVKYLGKSKIWDFFEEEEHCAGNHRAEYSQQSSYCGMKVTLSLGL